MTFLELMLEKAQYLILRDLNTKGARSCETEKRQNHSRHVWESEGWRRCRRASQALSASKKMSRGLATWRSRKGIGLLWQNLSFKKISSSTFFPGPIALIWSKRIWISSPLPATTLLAEQQRKSWGWGGDAGNFRFQFQFWFKLVVLPGNSLTFLASVSSLGYLRLD